MTEYIGLDRRQQARNCEAAPALGRRVLSVFQIQPGRRLALVERLEALAAATGGAELVRKLLVLHLDFGCP